MTVIWGGTFPIVKVGMVDISPILLIAIRFVIVASLLAAFFWRRILPLRWETVMRGSILGLFLFLGFVAQNIGLTITTASKSAFITGMMVVFVPILQYVIERRPPRLGNLVGIVIVCVGLWLLTSPEGSALNAGDALTLVCAILFAMYIVYLDVVSQEMTALQLVFLQVASTAFFAVAAVLMFETPRLTLSPTSIGALMYLTFLATLLTTYGQTRYQKDTTPTRAAVIFSVEPVFAAAAAALILNEHVGATGMTGGALILCGVLVSELSDKIPGLRASLPQRTS